MAARSTLNQVERDAPGGDPLAAINYPHKGESVQPPTKSAQFPAGGVGVSMPVDSHPQCI
jgi:hypothetical protein